MYDVLRVAPDASVSAIKKGTQQRSRQCFWVVQWVCQRVIKEQRLNAANAAGTRNGKDKMGDWEGLLSFSLLQT